MNPNRTFAADFLAVVAKFDGESDRGAVLVCSSYLEDLLVKSNGLEVGAHPSWCPTHGVDQGR